MDLLKTPSVQSLIDSDLESVDSYQDLEIEELDEVEYALPTNEVDAPTLAEVLSAEDNILEDKQWPIPHLPPPKQEEEPGTCSALQAEFLQGVSQQLLQAQERSSAGAATTISVGKDGKLTVGTAHGQLLSFQEQTLRWVCNANIDRGAVSYIAYNSDSTRLLAGYARGLLCQYESTRGVVLRRVVIGCDIWGILRVTWAGTSALALDTGGSVWLVKFSRPLGVRSARTSCLFSGARGEVVAMKARDARILALATLSRVIIVAGGRAAGVRLGGPPDTLPVLEWSETDDRMLVCARAKTLQWLSVIITGSTISLRALQRFELKTTPLWLGWLGGSLAIFDVDENLRLWGEDYDKPLDLSQVEPVYASAFFKGVWTEGQVSAAMRAAGAGALGGAGAGGGALWLLGRRGVARVRPRDKLARAHAFIAAGRHVHALRLLCSLKGPEAKALATRYVTDISENPSIVRDKQVADQTIKLCLKYEFSDQLWGVLWEQCAREPAFVEALGDAIVRGDLASMPPSPDVTQALIERLASLEPALVERVAASLPLTALDPHRASVFTRERGLWRAAAAVAAALGGASGAMRELIPHVSGRCARGACACAGGALLLAAADALGGRGAGGRPLPDHARPSARHDALHALLDDSSGPSPLRVLVCHEAAAAVRLLEQSARDPPFAGPLAKQNRLRVARHLLAAVTHLQEQEDRVEVLEFICGQLSSGALPQDQEVIKGAQELAKNTTGPRADRAWLALVTRGKAPSGHLAEAKELAEGRPRVLWRINSLLDLHDEALKEFFKIDEPSPTDVNELFEFLQAKIDDTTDKNLLQPYLQRLIEFRPKATAAILNEHFPDLVDGIMKTMTSEPALEFGEYFLEAGKLRGDAAAAHFRNVCKWRPETAADFLTNNPGVVRPEDALSIVREAKLTEAEPICLEACGDPEAALDAILAQVDRANEDNDKERASRLLVAGCGVAGRGAGRGAWARLLRAAAARGGPPPAPLLDTLARMPVDDLIGATCTNPSLAIRLLECASWQARVWAVVSRVAAREAHAGLARARARAGRGARGGPDCARCGGPLASRPAARTAHCGRAFHYDCPVESTCASCGSRVPEAEALPPRAPRAPSPPRPAHALALVAPPRPDLEGVV